MKCQGSGVRGQVEAVPGHAAERGQDSRVVREAATGGPVAVRTARRPGAQLFGTTRWLGLMLLLAVVSGCAAPQHRFVGARPFDFRGDTFTYANELVWEYYFDAGGKWVHQRRKPEPDYTHHCFVVARSARQFFQNAWFDPACPKVDEGTYRRLVHRVVAIDPRHALPDTEKVVIPGYTNLQSFSRAEERILKAECGGAWRSYFQRGHWRMIFPFSRANQARMAERLIADLKQNRPPVVHIVRFPQLTINHALLLFDIKETEAAVVFSVYDPNKPDSPKELTFDRVRRAFQFPANDYFPGGRVEVYEIYRSWNY